MFLSWSEHSALINHAQTHMRKGEWAEAAKVSGIECVGLLRSCPFEAQRQPWGSREAHEAMESNQANGKMVVRL